METNQKGIDLIKFFEGCKLTAYLCPAGIPTIGYGHTGTDVTQADVGKKTITKEQAEALLISDLPKYEKGVTNNVKSVINQNQFDALVSFVYNLGEGNFKSSTLLKKINANPNDATIRNEFNKWINSNGKPLSGLVIRRKQEADLYFT
jgi:lysozyme